MKDFARRIPWPFVVFIMLMSAGLVSVWLDIDRWPDLWEEAFSPKGSDDVALPRY